MSASDDFDKWLAEAQKAIVEEEAHLIRSVVVEAWNRACVAASLVVAAADQPAVLALRKEPL